LPRISSRRKPRRKFIAWKRRLVWAAAAGVVAILVWAAIARGLAPAGNTALTRFDAIVVLGSPADADGNPTPTELARVNEAVHEYQRGVAPRLIVSGAAGHNRFVEAEVMARSAEAQGIPASAIVLETQAEDTMQNACYAVRIMESHGWHSAEVISNSWHLQRAGLIFSPLPVEWRTHAAPPLTPESAAYQTAVQSVELLKTARYLTWARWRERCEP
jgi:uncharacterized SAM-binding protein YcdF (DUF218 family)